MVTELGTVTDVLLLTTLTAVPAAAAFDKVTVQLVVPPVLTVDGLHVTDETLGGATRVSVALDDPFNVAVT